MPECPSLGGTAFDEDRIARLRSSPFAVSLVCLVALLLLVISETGYFQAVKSLDQLGPMALVRLRNVELAAAMTDAETAQRGYLLTSRDDYLASYRAAALRVGRLLEPLRRLLRERSAARASRRTREPCAAQALRAGNDDRAACPRSR